MLRYTHFEIKTVPHVTYEHAQTVHFLKWSKFTDQD